MFGSNVVAGKGNGKDSTGAEATNETASVAGAGSWMPSPAVPGAWGQVWRIYIGLSLTCGL